MTECREKIIHAKPKKHTEFIILVGLLFLAIFARDVIHINLPNVVYLGIAAVSFMIFDYEECIAYTMMVIPLGCGLAVNYIIGIALIFMIIKYKLIITKLWFPFLILVVFELLHIVVPPFVISDYLRWTICMVMLMYIAYSTKPIQDKTFIVMSFVIASLFILIDIFIQTVQYAGGLSILTSGMFRFGTIDLFFTTKTKVISSLNQNTVGQLATIALAVLLILLHNKRIKMVTFTALALMLLGFGFLCMSRTFVVTLIITIIAYILLSSDNIGQTLKYIVFSVALLALLAFVMDRLFPETIKTTLARFSEADVTSGRTEIFQRYNEFMFADPLRVLFGIGNLDKSSKTGIHSPHNALQELFVSWGVVGIVLMIFIISNMMKSSLQREKGIRPLRIGWLAFVPLFVSVQAGQLFSMNEKMLYFALCFVALQIKPRGALDER